MFSSLPSDIIQGNLFGFTDSPMGHPSSAFFGRRQTQQRCSSRFPQHHHRRQDPFEGHRRGAWHHHHRQQQHPHLGHQQRPGGRGLGLDFSIDVRSPFADMFGFGCGRRAAAAAGPSGVPPRRHHEEEQQKQHQQERAKEEEVVASPERVSKVGTAEEAEEEERSQEPTPKNVVEDEAMSFSPHQLSESDDLSSWDVASSYSVIDDVKGDWTENDNDEDSSAAVEPVRVPESVLASHPLKSSMEPSPSSSGDAASTAAPLASSATATATATAASAPASPQKSENEWLLSIHIPSCDGSNMGGRDLRVVVPNTASLATLNAACLHALEPSPAMTQEQQQQQQQQPFNFAFFGKILCGPPTKQLREFGIGDNALLFAATGRYADPDALKLYMIHWELDQIIIRRNGSPSANTAAEEDASKERRMMNESVIKLLIKLDGLTDVEGHLRLERKRLVKECNAVIDSLGFGDSVS